jgi:anhydro-N-acetylmuramic acid kinase
MSNAKYYIGLMSGTSADGIDLALVDFSSGASGLHIVGSYYKAYSREVADKITSLYNPDINEIDRSYTLDIELAHLFSEAINEFLLQEDLLPNDITAIGNHGQTIRHRPDSEYPFTVQIGCSQMLSTLTNIRVVGQFRRKDMALGGQGAPLVPAFHQHIFSSTDEDVFVVNIGGIANITFLPKVVESAREKVTNKILGFDTGPGNALLDDWFKENHQDEYLEDEHLGEKEVSSKTQLDGELTNKKLPNIYKGYDENGEWASQGYVNDLLLTHLLSDQYFSLAEPKSTGREYFNLNWLFAQLTDFSIKNNQSLTPKNVQATLVALTADSISDAISKLATQGKVYLCGGGVHNKALMTLLNQQLSHKGSLSFEVLLTQEKNIDGDSLEAVAFAWLAYAFDEKLPSNIPEVTGAKAECVLGTSFIS